MFARVSLSIAFASLALAVAGCDQGGTVVPDTAPDASAAAGAKPYADTCALCHGAAGEGYAADGAPALASSTFLATATDDFLARAVARGRPGTTMSAWDQAHAGPYDAGAIASLVAFLRTWQTTPSVDADAVVVRGDPSRGAPLFAAQCSICHGATGTEGPYVRLANPELLAAASDGFLRYAIEHGRPGSPMSAFAGMLTAQDMDDVVSTIRSWQTPVTEGDAGDIPIPGTAGPVLLNPGGPDPGFVLGQRYTPADTVKYELDQGAAMVILDARAPSDYTAGHVAGAIDLPFYEVSSYFDVLPRDRWIVCYCACPHAESGRAADTLTQHGFTQVTIIDEGFYVWRDRGYPVHMGALP
jgi:cytochrome c oxidase cbb3-type subunit 3/ubiquinol-cytochrome c reductase cytochrome c subunit